MWDFVLVVTDEYHKWESFISDVAIVTKQAHCHRAYELPTCGPCLGTVDSRMPNSYNTPERWGSTFQKSKLKQGILRDFKECHKAAKMIIFYLPVNLTE